MKTPSLSIIVVSFKTRDLLRTCLNSILSQIDRDNVEVIVVDNASRDGSALMVEREFSSVTLLKNTANQGFGFACNQGWKHSKGEFVLFSNGDIGFPADLVSAMQRSIESDPKIGILSPELVGTDGSLYQMTWGWNISLFGEMRQKLFSPRYVSKFKLINWAVSFLQQRETDVPIVAGACMITRRGMLDRINGFDEDFELYFEDADLCIRCWEAGYSVRFMPHLKVFHGLGQSGQTIALKIALVYRQSQITYYRKHHHTFQLVLLKIYLWIKFLFSKKMWVDADFRYWMTQILFERCKVHLDKDLTLNNTPL